MSKRNDGGPAYPMPGERDTDGCGIVQPWPGMSLRARFAGRAHAAFLGNASLADTISAAHAVGMAPSELVTRLAVAAVIHADALLAALEEGE